MLQKIFPAFFFIFLLTFHHTSAQIEQPKRFEINIDEDDKKFTILSAAEKGVIMFRQSKERVSGINRSWQIMMLDTGLNVVQDLKYEIASEWYLRGYEYMKGNLYLLFQKGEYNNKNLNLISFQLSSGDTTHTNIKVLFPMELTEFTIVGTTALLGGYVNYRPAIVQYNIEEKRLKVLPGFYKNYTELIEVKVDSAKNYFSVVMTERTLDRRYTVSINTFAENGDLLNKSVLEPDDNYSILYGRTTRFENNTQFLAGTYSYKRSTYSRGLFIAKVDDEGQKNINYYNYGELENFFKYMKAKREKRVKERIARKKVTGKKLKFNYRLLVHDIIEKDGQYIMIGEAFYPTYKSSIYNMGFGGYHYGSPAMNDMSFAGYRYTHAVVVGFDKNGKMLWDNSFEINDVLSFYLEKFVHLDVDDDKIVLLYNFDNVIRSKLIKENQVLEGKTFDDIRLMFDNEVARKKQSEYDNEMTGLEKWYDKYFFAYGTQKIKNSPAKGGETTREVFYINKIIYK